MIDRFKRIKNDMIINLEYTKLVINNLDSIKIKSNKLKTKKQWLKRLY
tara:strand:- start:7100 stop:7243 length:144 start_codon:yes stop_codon:yes gene_type:complete